VVDAVQKSPPLPSLVAVTGGLVIAGIILLEVPEASSVVFAIWVAYAAASLLLAAVAMGRDVAAAGRPGAVVGVLVVLVAPLGIALWWRWRRPGPVVSPFDRRVMVWFTLAAAAGLVLIGALVVVLHD